APSGGGVATPRLPAACAATGSLPDARVTRNPHAVHSGRPETSNSKGAPDERSRPPHAHTHAPRERRLPGERAASRTPVLAGDGSSRGAQAPQARAHSPGLERSNQVASNGQRRLDDAGRSSRSPRGAPMSAPPPGNPLWQEHLDHVQRLSGGI